MRFSMTVLLTCLCLFPNNLTARAAYPAHSSCPTYIHAQDPTTPTPTPTPDAELEKLQRETKLAEQKKATAEARKAEAEADKAAVEAQLAAEKARLAIGATTTTATAPSGNITTSENYKFIETQLLAEFSARKASELMLTRVCNSSNPALKKDPIKKLVIAGSAEKSSILTYSAIVAQLGFLHSRYGELIDQAANAQKLPDKSPDVVVEFAAPLLIPAATEAVKAAADLINMFRTDTQFKDQAVTVDTRMIVTLLTNTLLSRKEGACKVGEIYYPSIYGLSISPDASQKPLLTIYRKLLDDISKGDQTVAANNAMVAEPSKTVQHLDEQIDNFKKAIKAHEIDSKKPPPKSKGKKTPPHEPFDLAETQKKLTKALADKNVISFKIDTLKKTAANLDSFKASLADLLKVLTAVDATTSVPALASLLRAERLSDLLKDSSAYSLEMQVTASGTNRIRKNAFFNAKIAHSGGVSIGLNLFNNQDQLVLGQLEQYYIDFTNSKDIRRMAGFQKLDSTFAGTPAPANKQESSHH